MKLLTLISPLALAAALAFSGSAMAQTMVGGVEVSAEDMAMVQEKCAALAAAATQSAAGDQATDQASDDDGAQDDPVDPSAKSNVEGLLGTLTAEQCEEAKLMPMGGAMAASGTSAMAADVTLSKDDPDVIAACAAINAEGNQSAAGDQATDAEANDDSAQDNPADPSSKHAQMVAGLDAKACADLGL